MNDKISYKAIFLNRRAFWALLSVMIAMLNLSFFVPSLAVRLGRLGIDSSFVGYFFSITTLMYSVFAPVSGWLSSKIDCRYTACAAFFLNYISLICLGPSELLEFPEELYLVVIGLIFTGFCVSFIFVPSLGEIVAAV